MQAFEQARFDTLYAQHLTALKRHGKADKTVDSYARAVRRVARVFDRCPDDLSVEELQQYFAGLIDSHSWSMVKIDRHGLRFFHEWRCHRHPRLLFPGRAGAHGTPAAGVMNRGGTQKAFRRVAADVGIRKTVSIHSLGHVYATRLMEACLHLRGVQTLLRHACPKTTARYVHMTETIRGDGHDTVNRLMAELASATREQTRQTAGRFADRAAS